MAKAVDLIVETANPVALDSTVQQLGAALVQDESDRSGYARTDDGNYLCRAFGDPGFMKFALERQGYARVVGEREVAGGE